MIRRALRLFLSALAAMSVIGISVGSEIMRGLQPYFGLATTNLFLIVVVAAVAVSALLTLALCIGPVASRDKP